MKKLFFASLSAMSLFILASCGGGSNEASKPAETAAAPAKTEAAAPAAATGGAANGEEIYKKTCIACHQANGAGVPNTFPPLAKSDFIADKEKTVTQVIKGKTGELVVNGVKYNNTMPPQNLKDEEIAAVLTYVYSNFGNSGGPVTADEVKAIRAKLQ